MEQKEEKKFLQKPDGKFRKVSGMWYKKRPDNRFMAKSGLINREGWQNIQAFGENTLLLIVPNVKRRKKSGDPEFWLMAVEHHPAEWMEEQKKKAEENPGLVSQHSEGQPSGEKD